MPSKIFQVETVSEQKPYIFLLENHFLIDILIRTLQQSFQIILLSKSRRSSQTEENLHIIHSSSAYLIDQLVERIDYSVLYLQSNHDIQLSQHILNKIIKDHTKTAIILPFKDISLFFDFIDTYKAYSHITFLFLGDVFGKEAPNDSFLSHIISSLIQKKEITVTGNDLFPIFPIAIPDALTSVYHVLFSHSKQFLYLFYEHPHTVISAIHLLKRLEPDLSIKYTDAAIKISHKSFEELQKELVSRLQISPFYLDSYLLGFEKSVKVLMETPPELSLSSQKHERHSSLKQSFPKRKRFKIPKKIPILIKAAVSAMVLYVVVVMLASITSVYYFKKSLTELQSFNINRASSAVSKSQSLFHIAEPVVFFTASVIDSVRGNSSGKDLVRLYVSSQNLIAELLQLIHTSQSSSTLTQSDINTLSAQALFLYLNLQELKTVDETGYVRSFSFEDYSPLISISPLLGEILGVHEDKTYLLLFQNNFELRPTGGFIGSVGELTLSHGKIKNLAIHDVYDYDGQLKDHREPHYIIRRYLQPHLYLRDSNFDLDFEKSASTAAQLYNLEGGKKVDGVIAIDFEVLREIMKAVGPVKLIDYKETITEANAFDFLENTIDSQKFEGSQVKKDLLNQLFSYIMIKLEGNPALYTKLLKSLPTLLSEKHILVTFPQQSLQSAFTANNFSGGYQDFRMKTDDTILDMFSLNEANIGVNKENKYIERVVRYDLYLDNPKEIRSKASLTIVHKKEGGKAYKAYIRMVAPLGSSLSSISINSVPQTVVPAITNYSLYEAKNFSPPQGLEVDTTTLPTQTVFGFIISVNPGQTQSIEVTYKSGIPAITTSLYDYSLFFIKQPGTLPYPFTLTVHYGSDYSPQGVKDAYFGNQSITLSTTVRHDQEFRIPFLKNK